MTVTSRPGSANAQDTLAAEVRDIQGNILRAYRLPVAAHLFIHFDDARSGRALVSRLADRVTTAERGHPHQSATLNVAFTFAGLRTMGVAEDILSSFPDEFQQGMAARAERLGDTGPSGPSTWEEGFGSGRIHAMVAIHASSAEALDVNVDEVEASMRAAGGVSPASPRQDATRLPDNREHFGFRDGFGQPWVAGTGQRGARNGQGTPAGTTGWKPVALGEFVLGYPDEEEVLPVAPRAGALTRNSTFLVYRKLKQNVAEFRRFVREQAVHLGRDEELVAAKIVGRWRDGSPLELQPDQPDAALGRDMQRNNDFRYAGDHLGMRCPIGAHIRRANPRDALGFNEQMVSRHRLIRRGIPYGPALPHGVLEDDGVDRGLLFFAAMASLSRQFEFVQSQWLNDGNIFSLGDDRDVITGDHDGTGKMTVQGSPPKFLSRVPLLTVTRGGEYMFMPGIAGLRWLAG